MWDSGFWPGALLQDILNISSVEVLPLPVLLPWNWEYEQSIPNPVAYVPQFATVFTLNMVSSKCCQALCAADSQLIMCAKATADVIDSTRLHLFAWSSQLHQVSVYLCVMQSFLQRVQNYVTNIFVKQMLIKRMLKAKQQEFVAESGQSYKTFKTGKSTAAAVIVVTDWALQFPQPMPPRVHVSSRNSSAYCHTYSDS